MEGRHFNAQLLIEGEGQNFGAQTLRGWWKFSVRGKRGQNFSVCDFWKRGNPHPQIMTAPLHGYFLQQTQKSY